MNTFNFILFLSEHYDYLSKLKVIHIINMSTLYKQSFNNTHINRFIIPNHNYNAK